MADRIGRLLGNVFAGPDQDPVAVASPPATNGNGKRAPSPTEAKGVITPPRADFIGPNGTANLIYVDGLSPSDVDTVSRRTAFAAAVYAYAAMSYRAEKVSEPPLMVVEEDDDGNEEWLTDHPLADLLEEPSPDFDMGEILYQTRLYRDATGAALWVLNENLGGQPGMITVFDGDSIRVKPATVDGMRRLYGRFEVRTVDGEWREYGPDEVVYFREAQGVAPLHVALSVLNLGKRAEATVQDILRNALFPSIVVQAHPEWSPDDDDFEKWQNDLRLHAERGKKGGPLGLQGGGTATVVSQNLKNLMPDEILDRVEAMVSQAFRVPPIVLHAKVGLENSPWSQMADARRMTYEDLIEPLWRRDEKAITRQLLRVVDPAPNRYIRFDTSNVRALQIDRNQNSEIVERTADIGTLNERRALMGWEPRDGEEGDEIVGLRSPEPFRVDLGDGKALDVKAVGRGSRPESKRDLAWLRFDFATKAQEPIWRRAAAKQLAEDAAVIGTLAVEHLKEAKAADPDSARSFLEVLGEYLTGPARKAWEAVIGPLIESTGEAAVKEVATELGISFEVLQPGLLEYTAKEAAWLVTQVTDTTKASVRAALEAGIEAGESVPDIAKRIRESDAAFGKARSELIARTETTRVTNGAQRDSLSDYAATEAATVTKSWLTARDARVRDHHAALDGEKVGIDETFSDGSEAPHEPNCRCTLLYDLED